MRAPLAGRSYKSPRIAVAAGLVPALIRFPKTRGNHKGCNYKKQPQGLQLQEATTRVAATRGNHKGRSYKRQPQGLQLQEATTRVAATRGNHKGCSYKSIQGIVAAGLVPALISLSET